MLAPATCQLESQASASQPPLLRGASLADSRKLASTASTNASAGHVEPPAPVQLLASVKTEPVNRTAGEAGAAGAVGVAADGFFSWGHGHPGETCCMCSYQYGGPSGTVVVFAAEDYDNAWGGHDAYWHCEHECELKCQGSHRSHKLAASTKRTCLVWSVLSDMRPASAWNTSTDMATCAEQAMCARTSAAAAPCPSCFHDNAHVARLVQLWGILQSSGQTFKRGASPPAYRMQA